MMMRRLTTLVIPLGSALLGGCMLFHVSKPATEDVQRSVDASKLQAVAVIAGNDSRADLRMSAMVRQKLTDAGVTAMRRSGRWGSENEAMADICPAGQAAAVDGVLFVYYNQLTLWDCRSRVRAIDIRGGDESGLPGMANRLVRYLKPDFKGASGKPDVSRP